MVADKIIAARVSEELLKIGAIKLSPEKPFTWASGWKSPIYCDNRLSLSYPEIRTYIKINLEEIINQKFKGVEGIAGVATAGIPMGALIADDLNLPFNYVRSSPKGHGLENLIEGRVIPNQKVVVVEDLISTGGSSISAIKALQNQNVEVLGLVAIFSYDFDVAKRNFEEINIPFFTLSSYPLMVNKALEEKYVSEGQIETLSLWREDPANWG